MSALDGIRKIKYPTDLDCAVMYYGEYPEGGEDSESAAAELLALRERVAKLERIETIAREILDAVKSGVVVRDAKPCKHGNFATAPYNHPRWCDECFFELEDVLSQ